jgi:hypothetical protein
LNIFQILLLSLRDLGRDVGQELFGFLFRGLALRDILLDFLLLLSRLDSLEWVKLIHKRFVLEWVPSLSWMENLSLFLVSQDTLDLIGIDDRVNIWVGDDFSLESVVSLLSRSILRSELFGELSHSSLGIDSESSQLTTRGKSLKTESLDIDNLNSRNISKSSSELLSLVVNDNKRSFLESIFLSSDLRDSSSNDLSLDDSLDILVTSESLKENNSLFGLLDIVNLIVQNKW